jgi:hypothetical protein
MGTNNGYCKRFLSIASSSISRCTRSKMKINQLTETDPIELARAVLTADDVQDFPIIHYAASQLLNALKTFEVEAAYFEYDDAE